MILVAGSTGFLGGEICRRLTSQGKAVRGLVRATSNPERVAALKASGVQTIIGDLRTPATLVAACQGITTVISTVTTTISMQPGDSIPATDQQGQLNLVEAAHQAGVEHFIYISFSASVEKGLPPSPLTTAKRIVEQALMASGMQYTILRPCNFMEIWLSPRLGFDYPNAKANIFGDGHARLSFISLGDVAQYAVESVDNQAARKVIFELGGPKAVSWLEAVHIFEQHCGNSFELRFIPAAVFQAQKEAATDPLQKSFAGLMLSLTKDNIEDLHPARQAFSFPLTSIENYAQRVLG